jgi:hypothetical protein
MAKVALVLHIPKTTADELKQIVHDVDALEYPDAPIASVNVAAEDVLALILSGQYNPQYKVLLTMIENCAHCSHSPESGPCGAL